MQAIILAGGRSSRMGEDKALISVGGETLLRRVLDACEGCSTIVLVAPEETASSLRSRPGLLVTLEDPPLGGPVAGIAAGLAALEAAGLDREDPWVLLLSVDLAQPREVVAALRGADAGASDGVCLSDGAFPQYLAARYRWEALHRALGAVEARNCSVKRLMAPLDLTQVVVSELVSADLDTLADVALHRGATGRPCAGRAD